MGSQIRKAIGFIADGKAGIANLHLLNQLRTFLQLNFTHGEAIKL